MRRAALLLLAAVVVAGCAGDDEPAPTTVAPPPPAAAAPERTGGPFDYDARAPLLPTSKLVAREQTVTVHDVTYESPGGRVNAYLVEPGVDESRPVVIFMPGAGGNRDSMLPLAARWVALGGVAFVLEDAPTETGDTPLEILDAQRDAAANTVIRVRRAVDYLQGLGRGGGRIGYVGWSSGARTGAMVAAIEPRISAFVLMSGAATPLSEYRAVAPPELGDDIERVLRDVDPLRWVARARPSTIFFQNATEDEIVPRKALKNLIAAARKPQRVRWYDAPHELNSRAHAEGRRWLAVKLGLP